jgi:hypothetical protein
MVLSEKIVNTDKFGGTVDLISGIEDFKSTCTYNEEFHTYRFDGKIIPSVTQLLEDDTYINVDKEILEYAQRKGTLVHKEIEDYIKNGIKGYTDEFWEFLEIYNNNKNVFNDKGIYDIKTYSLLNKKNKEKCLKQLEMYSQAIEYLTGIKIDNLYMIHLPKNKKGKLVKLK